MKVGWQGDNNMTTIYMFTFYTFVFYVVHSKFECELCKNIYYTKTNWTFFIFSFEQRMWNANKFASTRMYHNVNLNNDCSVILWS
jgi:hypothetical protein